MNKITYPQKSFAESVERFLDNDINLASDEYCIVCVCQLLHSYYGESCNPYFFFGSENLAEAKKAISTFCTEFQKINLLLPGLKMDLFYKKIKEIELNRIISDLPSLPEDDFLREALAAYWTMLQEINNPYLVVNPQGKVPNYSDLM